MTPHNENGSHHTLRSAGGILAGLLVIVALSIGTDELMRATGVFPPKGTPMADPLFLIPTTYRSIYSVLGCYIAALLAPRDGNPMRNAMILGIIGVVVGVIGFLVTRNHPDLGPTWYSIAIFAIALPCAWVGGKLESMRRGKALMNGART